MDGTFSLGRRKKAGKLYSNPLYKDKIRQRLLHNFILTTEESRSCLTQKQRKSCDEFPCSNFRAIDVMKKSDKFDESGLFGIVCARHDMPLLSCDMFGGEKFETADAVLVRLLNESGLNKDVKLFYDLGCKFQVHLKVIQ